MSCRFYFVVVRLNLYLEDFETGIPEDWTLTTNSAQGWYLTTDCTSEWWTVPAHTNYMCSNDDQANDDGSVDYLVTHSLNVSGAASVILSFDSYPLLCQNDMN